MITPTMAPAIWATTYAASSTRRSPPKNASAQLTTGFRCAPETDPTARMMATRAAPVAAAFSSSSRPVSPGLRFWAAIPEPITAIRSSAVPMNSARTRCPSRAAEGSGFAAAGRAIRSHLHDAVDSAQDRSPPRRSRPGLRSKLHRVPWTAEWWCVTQIEIADLIDRLTGEQRRGVHVDAFGHFGLPVAEDLGTEQLARPTVTGDADRQLVGAGVVRLVVPHLRLHRQRIEAGAHRLLVAQARSGNGDIEDLDDLRPKAPLEQPLATDGVFPGHATLLVGGRAEGQVGRGLQDAVPGLDAITRREHIGDIGSHAAIDPNGSLFPGLDTGLGSQTRVWHHAGRNQHQVRRAVVCRRRREPADDRPVHARYVRLRRPHGP